MNRSHAEEQRAQRLLFVYFFAAFFFFCAVCLKVPTRELSLSLIADRKAEERGKDVLKWNRNLAGAKKRKKKKRRLHERYSPMWFHSFSLSGKKKKISQQTLEKSHFLELK